MWIKNYKNAAYWLESIFEYIRISFRYCNSLQGNGGHCSFSESKYNTCSYKEILSNPPINSICCLKISTVSESPNLWAETPPAWNARVTSEENGTISFYTRSEGVIAGAGLAGKIFQRVAIPERYSNVFKDTFQPVCSASAFPFAFKIRLFIDGLQLDKLSPDEIKNIVKERNSINPKMLILAAGGINKGIYFYFTFCHSTTSYFKYKYAYLIL